jgi:hypothetical protein
MPDRRSGVEKRQSQGMDGVRQDSFQSGSRFGHSVKQIRKPNESLNNKASSKAMDAKRESLTGFGSRFALPRN